ncbi:MAG: hypothetical protein H6506_01805 [Calditrichaeota bacterium]|nr:hypothetical protein [Calditrichota bacterium]MCB9391366.1 hypothetical protein [Calditrichota bacterium]
MVRSDYGFRIKHILAFSFFVLTSSALLFTGCSVTPAEGKLQVMFTGNIRGNVSPCGCKISKGGVGRLEALVQRNTDPSANWLMVDAGNFVDRAGAKGGCSEKCQFLVSSYEGLHYDVLNIARSEIAMGYETLVAMRDTVDDVEFVAANLLDVKANRPMFEPYIIKDYGNMKVGVIGLLRDADFPETSNLLDPTEMRVTSTFEAADRFIPEVAKKSNAIVLLCELSTDDLDSLIKVHPEIDLVVSTGALRSGETSTMFGKTRVLGTGSSGYNGHYAMLEFNPAWGDSTAFSDYKDALTDSYESESELNKDLLAFEVRTGTGKRGKAEKEKLEAESFEVSPASTSNRSPVNSHG